MAVNYVVAEKKISVLQTYLTALDTAGKTVVTVTMVSTNKVVVVSRD